MRQLEMFDESRRLPLADCDSTQFLVLPPARTTFLAELRGRQGDPPFAIDMSLLSLGPETRAIAAREARRFPGRALNG